MAKFESPKVIIFKGIKIDFKIGSIKKFIKPRIPPVKKRMLSFPLYSIPEIKLIVWLWLILSAK